MSKFSFSEILKDKVIVFDGAMGTSIQKYSLTIDDYHGYDGCNEYLIKTKPDIIAEIHAEYFNAGCDVIETNTFGANKIVLADYNLENEIYELNLQAGQIAKNTAGNFSGKPRFVSGSMGPGSKLPSLLHTTYDILKDSYYEQACGLIDGGVDLLQIETCQDMLQAKAAYAGVNKALREKKKELPVIIQVTMEKTGRMLLGTDMLVVISTFSAFPLAGLGINCATGPKAMSEHVRVLSQYSPFSISVLPNAGLPIMKEGKFIYDLTPEELAFDMHKFVKKFGVNMVGGCCGTTPDHIKALADKVGNMSPVNREPEIIPGAASSYQSQPFETDPRPLIIGERTNATGSKKFRETLLADDIDSMFEIAVSQQKELAHLLDVSVAYAGRDEIEDMNKFVEKLNTGLELPLVIDTTNTEVLENALKRIGGKAVINSINLEDGGERAHEVLALAKEFGAAVICLTIDEKGMAKTVERKLEIASRIYAMAISKYNIPPYNLFFDPLTFTLGSGDPEYFTSAIESLKSISVIKKAFPQSQVLLGVSNVSFGLRPHLRHLLNAVFLYYGVKEGLDAAILHAGKILPLSRIPAKERKICEDLIFNRRTEEYDPLQELMKSDEKIKHAKTSDENWNKLSLEEKLKEHIISGRKADVKQTLDSALKKYSSLVIINDFLLEGMKVVGELFSKGEMQLPFVLQAAETMKAAVNILEPHIKIKDDSSSKGKMVLATVRGDVHDIGKNLVDIILSANGYKVYNIGIKQTSDNIINAIKKYKPDTVGLSGLLVKSTHIMDENLAIFNEHNIKTPVICGGAALNQKFTSQVLQNTYNGKVHYARNAMDGLHIFNNIITGAGDEISVSSQNQTEKELIMNEAVTQQVKYVQSNLTFEHDIPKPPFKGSRVVTGIPLESVITFVNQNVLFKSRWQIKENSGSNKVVAFTKKDMENMVEEMQKKAVKENLLELKLVYGYFPCFRRENTLIVVNPDTGKEQVEFTFPQQDKEPYLSIAKYFKDEGDDKRDIVAFQLVTSGEKAISESKRLYDGNHYSDYLFWHGFVTELTEALAEYWHLRIREELGFKDNDLKDSKAILKAKYRSRRYSFGYPACPKIEDQGKIFQLLQPERIGVSLSESYQLIPELSTSAIVVHHPQAKYFMV